METEFTFIGLKVPKIAILGGGTLILWGVVAYLIQDADPKSITAMIPSFLGTPLFILGVLSERDRKRSHHYMHASMIFALFMVVGGLRIITAENPTTLLIGSHLILIITGAIFMIAGIMSFRHTRKLREQKVV